METENVAAIFAVSKTEYAGRFAAVGYAAVVIGLTVQLLPVIFLMATPTGADMQRSNERWRICANNNDYNTFLLLLAVNNNSERVASHF